jgi:hypothetical protein
VNVQVKNFKLKKGFFSFEAKLKYDAWLALEDMPKEFAMRDYCITLDNMLPGWDKLHEKKVQKDFANFLETEKTGILQDTEDWLQSNNLNLFLTILDFSIEENEVISFEADLSFTGSCLPIKLELPQETYPHGIYIYKSLKNIEEKIEANSLKEAFEKMIQDFTERREKVLKELMEE